MRHLNRRRDEDEDESAFVSMTDMTVSFLFILMILLAFFASRYSDEEVVPKQLYLDMRATALKMQEDNAVLAGRANISPSELERLEDRITDLLNDSSLSQQSWELERKKLEQELKSMHKELASMKSAIDLFHESEIYKDGALNIALKEIDTLRNLITELQTKVARLLPFEKESKILNERIIFLQNEAAHLRARIAILEAKLSILQQKDPVEEYLKGVAVSRRTALESLRDKIRIEFPFLEVVISSESDALRFQGEGLFASDSRELTAQKTAIVERIAEILDGVLPCYSAGARSAHKITCNQGFAVIEAVQIEGHTDDDGTEIYNMDLASGRAVSTYAAMTRRVPGLLEHKNLKDQPVLSVAGYGESRPVVENNTEANRSTNRRIDLRFIMVTPKSSNEIEYIKARLSGTAAGM